jgi:cytochrome c551/c552
MMPPARRLAMAAILALSAVSAHAQDGDVAAGHAFAREACNTCHMVEGKQKKPRRIVIGPAFRDIANTRGMTATALRVFLTTSHPKMPNLILTPEEIWGWPTMAVNPVRRVRCSNRSRSASRPNSQSDLFWSSTAAIRSPRSHDGYRVSQTRRQYRSRSQTYAI